MSDEEIRREYRLAKDPKKQLKILADENDCSVSTIRSIVSADQLGGFVPIQELAEKEAKKEKDGVEENDSIPLRVTAEPEWPPLPSAPPQAAEDFDDLGPSSLPDVQDIPEASAGAGREAEYSADWRGLMRNLADGGWVPATVPDSPEEAPDAAAGFPHQSPAATASPQGKPGDGGASAAAGESGYVFRISGKDLSRMWHILGRLQGVLEASAEAGKPGEVMKDACDELEVLLMSLGENDPF